MKHNNAPTLKNPTCSAPMMLSQNGIIYCPWDALASSSAVRIGVIFRWCRESEI